MPSKSAPNTSHLYRMLIDLLHSPATKAGILASMADDFNWEFIDWSDDEMYLVSKDPTKCEGGTWWQCENAEQTYAQRPGPADIQALWATINYPGPGARPPCVSPCLSELTGQQATWNILRHKITKQWGLFVSKQCRWECLKPGTARPDPRRPENPNPRPPDNIA
jgi:hypothetical protein